MDYSENTSILTCGFDKLKTNIPPDYFIQTKELPNKSSLLGFSYVLNDKGFGFEISGKPFATNMSLGSIPFDHTLVEKIFEMSGILIDKDFLFYDAPVYRIDPFTDILVNNNATYYLSEIREVLKSKTNKLDILRYEDLVYKQGLTIIPKTKKNFRYNIYDKGSELKKARNKDFCSNFSIELLEKTRQCLRFECQYRNYDDMRHAFELTESATPTLAKIASCRKNLVKTTFEELLTV